MGQGVDVGFGDAISVQIQRAESEPIVKANDEPEWEEDECDVQAC